MALSHKVAYRIARDGGRVERADPRIAVVGATGAVGRVTLGLLRERGYTDVTAFASARSAGSTVDGLAIEEATPERLTSGDFDVCLFSVGTDASRELVPPTAAAGALCVDKSVRLPARGGHPARRPRGERKSARSSIAGSSRTRTAAPSR